MSGLMNKSPRSVTVTRSKTTVVAPVLPMRDHWLPLSNIDLLMPQVDASIILCYDKPEIPFESVVTTLMTSLAEVLVTYYIFAGEVVDTPLGESEVFCNNRGVDFIVAHADVDLSELDLHRLDESVGRGKLVPTVKRGVFCVQATELKCGSVLVCCTFNHKVADAYSTNMFLLSWSETATLKPLSLPPSFRRSSLEPRHPPQYLPYMDSQYLPDSKGPTSDEAAPFYHHTSRMYYVKADQILELQATSSTSHARRTKFESFSSYIWQLLAKRAQRDGQSEKQIKLAIVVDGRTRFVKEDDSEEEINRMKSYFGNLISIPCAVETVEDVSNMTLSEIAEKVDSFLKKFKHRDHFLDLIDFVEIHRPELTRLTCLCARKNDGPTFMVSSGQRFPSGKLDFGWGRPKVGSYYFPWQIGTGYIMPVPSPSGNGDWVVYMHLPKEEIEFIDEVAGHVFQPFSLACLPPY